MPNNQRQLRTSHAPNDVLLLRIGANYCAPFQPLLRAGEVWFSARHAAKRSYPPSTGLPRSQEKATRGLITVLRVRCKRKTRWEWATSRSPRPSRSWACILSPNNQRQHSTSHAPKDVLPSSRICANYRYGAIWQRQIKLPWREAGPPNHPF